MKLFLKILTLHILASRLALASTSSWAFQQIETETAQGLVRSNSPAVTVAMIDTGLDMAHPALKDSLWVNTGEIPGNGVDDDHNGFIDDVHGWNFVADNGDLQDLQGHGTHIAGLIGARSSQFSGVAPGSRLMMLKYYDPLGSPQKNLLNTIRAFQYAIDMKAQIINFSGGGPGANPLEEAVMRRAEENRVLVIAAAGNDRSNNDRWPYYPASYPLSNILSVTAVNRMDTLTDFGNYGRRSVHVAAPGENIRSTQAGGGYVEMSGTSQATAIVSGLAALILSRNPGLSPEQVVQKIKAGGDHQTTLVDKTEVATRINARRSLVMTSINENLLGSPRKKTAAVNPQWLISWENLDEARNLPHVDHKPRQSIGKY